MGEKDRLLQHLAVVRSVMASEACRDEKVRTIRLNVDVASLVDLVDWLDQIAGRPSLDSIPMLKIDDEAPIDALRLSFRVRNLLLRGGIQTVGELVARLDTIQTMRQMGATGEREIKESLRAAGALPGGLPLPTVTVQRGLKRADVFIDGVLSKHQVSERTLDAAREIIKSAVAGEVKYELDRTTWEVRDVPIDRADALATRLADLWRADYRRERLKVQ